METLDLNVATPEDVADVLRAAAEQFREAQADLASAWNDPQAGKVWSTFAVILERAAKSCDAACDKHIK